MAWTYYLLASLLSAGLLTLSLPGPDLSFLAFFALVPWGLASMGAPRKRWLVDWFFCLSFLSFSVYWIGYVSWIGGAFTILVESFLFLPFGWVFRRLLRFWPATFALPVAWCAVEFLRVRYPIGGLPYSLLGYSQYGSINFIQSADFLGVHLTSFLVAAVNGFLLDYFRQSLAWEGSLPAKIRLRLGAPVLAMLLVNLFYGVWAQGQLRVEEAGPRVVAIQPNIPSRSKERDLSAQEVLDIHLRLTREEAGKGDMDLLLWSEKGFLWPLGDHEEWEWKYPNGNVLTHTDTKRLEEDLGRAIRQAFGGNPPYFLFATFYYAREDRIVPRLAAVLKKPDGSRGGIYLKNHLVPGGEYIPSLGWITDLARSLIGLEGLGFHTQLHAGQGARVHSLGQWKISPTICYDNAYADVYLDGARKGADFHAVLSNEAWYGGAGEQDQLLAAAVFRAVETRRSVVRGTNSGVSALVGPSGKILDIVEQDGSRKEVAGILRCQVPICSSQGLYILWGDWPWWGLVLGALILSLLPKKGETRGSHQTN